jgi:acyl-CoA synthetase (AMP-forming)/AMP-acid ligase II
LDDVLLYLHSSGSTGLPKSIPTTFRSVVHWAGQREYSPVFVTGFLTYMSTKIAISRDLGDYKPYITLGAMALPAFHTMGVFASVVITTYGLITMSLYPPVVTSPSALPIIPTPENILDHLARTKSNVVITTPTMLIIWAQDKQSVDFLSTLEFIVSKFIKIVLLIFLTTGLCS